jgi:hypothetical protein
MPIVLWFFGPIYVFSALYLHTVVHELSHAAAAKLFGAGILKIKFLPSDDLGVATRGYVVWSWPVRLSDSKLAFAFAAPLVGETLWCLGAAIAYHLIPYPYKIFALGEMGGSFNDMFIWCSTLWKGHPKSDGQRFLDLSKIPVRRAKLLTIVVMIIPVTIFLVTVFA